MSRIVDRASTLWPVWGAALLTALASAGGAPARADARCPVDGAALGPAPRVWNTAGGVDSDGCAWGQDAGGRLAPIAPDAVVGCERCGAAFRRDLVPGSLTDGERGAVAAALQPLAGAAPTSAAARCERAAAVARALGAERLGASGTTDALAGELLLVGAWAARGHALSALPDVGFRPEGPREALQALRELERRALASDPAARERDRLDAALAELEVARAALPRGGAPADRLGVLAARARLAELERRLLEEKAQAAGAEREAPAPLQARLGLLGARLRQGDRAWAEELTALWAEFPDLAARLADFAAASATAERLLRSAGAALGAAAADARLGREQRARLAQLAGDCLRRIGEDDAARALLRDAADLAPESPAGRRAAALLEG